MNSRRANVEGEAVSPCPGTDRPAEHVPPLTAAWSPVARSPTAIPTRAVCGMWGRSLRCL